MNCRSAWRKNGWVSCGCGELTNINKRYSLKYKLKGFQKLIDLFMLKWVSTFFLAFLCCEWGHATNESHVFHSQIKEDIFLTQLTDLFVKGQVIYVCYIAIDIFLFTVTRLVKLLSFLEKHRFIPCNVLNHQFQTFMDYYLSCRCLLMTSWENFMSVSVKAR